ncbi:uncharacterized protein [Leptinotarsa decemlineata]|uniref:uncharacterized protein n=1 Tax=Leptinotarsa decemlineata TaxID=7539 RepID=UPI003D3080E2
MDLGKSETLDNLVDLESDVHEASANSQECIAIFFDISKAYDTVWRHSIIKKLHEWSIVGNSLKFITNFLNNRNFKVRVNGTLSSKRTQDNGVPQGTSLSVTLFLVAINSIIDDCAASLKARLYADDLVVFGKGKNFKTINGYLQNFFYKLQEWSELSGLRISESKTNCIHFTKRPKENLPKLQLNNKDIEYIKHTKFLVMIFDQKLNWNEHITYLKMTCQSGLNIMKTIASRSWGTDTNILMLIYRSLIRSKLNYGSLVYNSAKNGTLKKLDTTQNCALRIALGAFHTNPVESLYCESREPPLSIRRKHLSLTYAAAVQSNPDNPVFHNFIAQTFRNTFAKRKRVAIPFYERLNRFLSNLLLNRPEIFNTSNIPNPPPWTFPSIKIEKGLVQFEKHSSIHATFQQLLQQFEDCIQIYTDASKSKEGVGAAFTSTASKLSFKLPAESTVFSGELYAIWKALEYAEKSDHSKFLVITYSLSTLEAITKLNPEHPIILHIKHKLHSIIEKRKHIHFMWVPSHVGIAGNERADQLAKDAITNLLTDIEKRIAHPDMKLFYKQILTNVWQQQWNGSNSKLSAIKPLVLPWKSLPKTRKLQVIQSRLRLGHTRLTHEYILNDNNPPTCEVCVCAISVKHILSDCASYNNERVEYDIPPSIEAALGQNCNYEKLIAFLRRIKLLHRI